MRETIWNGLKRIASGIGYILKPLGVALAFSFALGRAYERMVIIGRGGRYEYQYA